MKTSYGVIKIFILLEISYMSMIIINSSNYLLQSFLLCICKCYIKKDYKQKIELQLVGLLFSGADHNP